MATSAGDVSGESKKVHTEKLFWIGPNVFHGQAALLAKLSKLRQTVFIAVFGHNVFASIESHIY